LNSPAGWADVLLTDPGRSYVARDALSFNPELRQNGVANAKELIG
jgi:hypothetical protein